MLLLTKKEIESVFSMEEAIAAVKEAFVLFSAKESQVPLRTQIPAAANRGTFLFMPAYAEKLEAASLKVVNIFPENAQQGLPSAPAEVLLMDGKTGLITALLDGTYVTQLRTGAASGAALDLLGNPTAKIGALIGTGSQAACQLEALLTIRDLTEVKIFSRNQANCQTFVHTMQKKFASFKTKISGTTTADEAIAEADLIITATSSKKPVFNGMKIKKGATISCVGSYQPEMQELDPQIFSRTSKIYFDSQEAVLAEAGDILKPLADGTLKKSDFTGDLGDLISGKIVGRENPEEIIVFKTVGIGTQDLVTAERIYQKATAEKIGTSWES